jgi:hypothetical protein
MITPGGKAAVPDSVKHLDADVVVEVLSRHAINVSDAAAARDAFLVDGEYCDALTMAIVRRPG